MIAWAPTWAPKGYRELVAADPSLSMKGVKPTGIMMTGGKWAELSVLNARVNRMAMHVNDPPGQDKWGPFRMLDSRRVGDCNDFAVHKLRALIKAGWPRGALLLSVCHIEDVGYHCVLLVQCRGLPAACMDSRDEGIWAVDDGPPSSYTWLSQEKPGQSFWWRNMK